MKESRSAQLQALRARVESISSAVEILAKLAGFIMMSLGLLSLCQAIGGIKDFSMPQTAQGLFGALILAVQPMAY